MKIIKPRALKKGQQLGIVTCSTPITVSEEMQKRAYQRLAVLGFRIKIAPNCHKEIGHTDPLITFLQGIPCKINTSDLSIEFLEASVV